MKKDMTMQSKQSDATTAVLDQFIGQIIDGPLGLNAFEDHEYVVFEEPERNAVARWVLRCLANTDNLLSGQVLNAIHAERRRRMSVKAKAVRS